MTTYNGEKFLREQLDSMLRQSRQVDELVVCDDGSVDETVNILNEFSSATPFPVRIIINEKNLGSTKNFEKAISLCEGDIVVLCDQDDIWLPDKVRVLEDVFLTNPNCGMAFTNAMVVDEMNNPQGELWRRLGFSVKKQKILKDGKGFEIFVKGNIVTGATAAVKKPFFKEVAPLPALFVHDYWLATVAALKNRLFFCGAVTVNYRQHSSQQLGVSSAIDFFQNANDEFNNDRIIEMTRAMLEELDGRYHLTEEQRGMFMEKIEFYTFRKNVSPRRLAHILKITLNLFAGNYHKHSSGFLSAAKDLITSGKRAGGKYAGGKNRTIASL
jgi:glycosyltransferase involved in cell wall biosynthesis